MNGWLNIGSVGWPALILGGSAAIAPRLRQAANKAAIAAAMMPVRSVARARPSVEFLTARISASPQAVWIAS
jgi:hypothetical protein